MKEWPIARHIFIILFFLITQVSCGGARKPASENIKAAVEYLEVENIAEPELSIAKRICYAYRSKRASLNTNYHGKNLTFKLSKVDCEKKPAESVISAKVVAPLGEVAHTLSANQTVNDYKFLTSIQDDEYGFISKICQKIYRGLPVSNTVEDGTELIQVKFFKSKYDYYRINYFTQTAGREIQNASDLFRVRTQTEGATTGTIMGFDEEVTRYKKCSNSDEYAEFLQTYLAT